MKTKSFLMAAGVLCVCVAAHADESEKQILVQIPVQSGQALSADTDFVVPVPKDESGFTVKPPDNGAVMLKPIKPPMPQTPTVKIIPGRPPSPPFRPEVLKLTINTVAISSILSILETHFKIRIVACFTPGQIAENTKITMSLAGKTPEDFLTTLGALGLVWRKTGDTYYVAWSERELPPLPAQTIPTSPKK